MPPIAGEPKLTLPGPCFLQYSTYSLAVLTGMLLFTASTLATSPNSATGAKAVAVSYGIFL